MLFLIISFLKFNIRLYIYIFTFSTYCFLLIILLFSSWFFNFHYQILKKIIIIFKIKLLQYLSLYFITQSFIISIMVQILFCQVIPIFFIFLKLKYCSEHRLFNYNTQDCKYLVGLSTFISNQLNSVRNY